MTRKYETALRAYARNRIEKIGKADVLIGVPCFNNETTIEHVLRTVSVGLAEHYPDRRCVVVVSDGGSTDDTREVAKEYEPRPWQEKLVFIYRGLGGKGTALRAIFEAAHGLQADACAVVDSDLRSISPAWVKSLIDPVLEDDYEYVAPIYTRYKYDGTITNNIVYNLTRALYGKRIRQPIGGDFAFSSRLAKHYLDQRVWETDIARFGIDIWMTLNAIVDDAKICQANLGLKVHDAKDPAEALGPMFRQVCGTFFNLMEENEDFWMSVDGSEAVPTFGEPSDDEPEAIQVNEERMIRSFQEGFRQFGPVWQAIFSPQVFSTLEAAAASEPSKYEFHTDTWVDLLYELAAKYCSMTVHRGAMLNVMTPLYLARVAGFIQRTRDMSSAEAEAVVEEQAHAFEARKDYLVRLWDEEHETAGLEAALGRH
jgi:hypothetical protein